jgi:hypothetical protein
MSGGSVKREWLPELVGLGIEALVEHLVQLGIAAAAAGALRALYLLAG